MEWTDQGIVVDRRRHGEHAAIVALLTREHGRHLGLVRGGAGSRASSLYQTGSLVAARWRGRLPEHLGSYSCEPLTGFAAGVLDDPLRLAALASAAAIIELACPEREPHARLFEATLALLRGLREADWAARYVEWERECLSELGFGLDLSACAATGRPDRLAYVSPRTGRAVSAEAGGRYADRLFALPAFMTGAAAAASKADIMAGLELTGHFIERHVLAPHHRRMPPARQRLVERWRRQPADLNR